MALTLDFSNLTAYTDQLTLPIIRNTILASTLMEIGINYQENVTNTSVLNIMNSTLSVQAGGACGAFSAAGSTTLSQRNITVCPLTIMEEECPDTFKTYWTKVITKAGSYNEADPTEYSRIYTAYKLEQVSAFVEDLFFCGSSTGTYSASLTQCNGILHNLEFTSATASVVVAGATYSGALTVANAIDVFYAMKNATPGAILAEKDLVCLMSHANYFTLTQALTAKNYFNSNSYVGSERDGGKLQIKNILGTNITVIPMRGLSTTNKMILTTASNLYLGTDLNNDYETVRVWYSMDFRTVRTEIKWRQGAIVAFPQNVVIYKG